jgi:N-acetylmuramoyl-L-alanine amidase
MRTENPPDSGVENACRGHDARFEPDSALVDAVVPTPNHSERKCVSAERKHVGAERKGKQPDMLVLHYTGMGSAERALRWLTTPESKVSAHYLIDDDGRIVQMAPEERRAWHAGASRWAGETDINSASIGVEIHNPGHDGDYPVFGENQMRAVEALCRDVVARHHIKAERVLAHSDVAPARKRDPGEKFDWARLARSGVGMWVEPVPLVRGWSLGLLPGSSGEAVGRFQSLLAGYGYGIDRTGFYDEATVAVVTAFQRHFRPERVDGRADPSTIATLERLLAAGLRR